jgi:hypothetical protein
MSDNDNLATIAALMVENDRLRAELGKAPNSQIVTLIAAFELWLEQEMKATEYRFGEWDNGYHIAIMRVYAAYDSLKVRHIKTECNNRQLAEDVAGQIDDKQLKIVGTKTRTYQTKG